MNRLVMLGIIFLVFSFLPDDVLAGKDKAEGKGKKREILVGFGNDFLPYHSTIKSKSIGFDIDIMDEIAKHMGINPVYKPGPWKKVLFQLKAGRLDLVLCASITSDRKKIYQYTDSYGDFQVVLFAPSSDTKTKGLEDLYGKKVAVAAGSNDLELLRQYRKIKIVQTKSFDDTLQKLINGQVQAAILDKIKGLYWLKKRGFLKQVRVVPKALKTVPFASIVRKGKNVELVKKYNAALKKMKKRLRKITKMR